MARVELRVHPPLYYEMSPQRVGPLVLEHAFDQGETLGDLLGRLSNGDHDGWRDIYDAGTRQLQPIVMVFLNTRAVSRQAAVQTPLSDGDRIAFHLVYGGG